MFMDGASSQMSLDLSQLVELINHNQLLFQSNKLSSELHGMHQLIMVVYHYLVTELQLWVQTANSTKIQLIVMVMIKQPRLTCSACFLCQFFNKHLTI